MSFHTMRLSLFLTAMVSCTSAIRNPGVEDEAKTEETVQVVADWVVDLTSNFPNGIMTDSTGQRYRCCKYKASEYAVVIAEKPSGKEPWLSGCRGLAGLLYKSFESYKDSPTCQAYHSGLPPALQKLKDLSIVTQVTDTMPKKLHPGTFWKLQVKVVDSRKGAPVKGAKIKGVKEDGSTVFGFEKTDSTGVVEFEVPFGWHNIQLRPESYHPNMVFYDKIANCPDTDECAVQMAIW